MTNSRYQTIADSIAARIRAGSLRPGTQLPTVRALMLQHKIALATASRVYSVLEDSGLIVGETGRGTFVRDISLPSGKWGEQRADQQDEVDLSFTYPLMPGQAEMLREGLRNLAATGDLDALLHSASQGGRPHERQTMAKHVRNRGIRVSGDQVLIVNGAQHGLAVVVMAFLKPGDVLAVDALTYPGMKTLAQAHRIELQPLPQIEGQTDLAALAALCRRRPVKAIYCMPTLHNPLGSVMPRHNRIELAELAERHDFLIIEDGAYAFLAEPAPPPVFTLAPLRTIYVCGLSKSVASGLRVGFAIAPPAWVPALAQAIRVSTWNTSSVTVALACRWIEDGEVDRLETEKRKDARLRQRLALRALQGCSIETHPSSYFLWLTLPEDQRADEVAAALKSSGVLVVTAEIFAATRHVPQALRIGLSSASPATLTAALQKIRRMTIG